MPLITKPGPTFSLGRLFRIDSAANPTPRQYGLVKSITLELSYNLVEMETENVFPEYGVKAGGKLGGKFEIQEDTYLDMLDIAPGSTSAAGSMVLAYKEPATIPTTPGPYTVTVTHAAQFSKNLGITDAATGKGMQRVASAPASGEYSLVDATGVYTFAAADQGKAIFVTYEYTSTAGVTTSISQSIAEVGTAYDSLLLYNETLGIKRGVYLPNITIPKLPWGFALKGFAGVALDFTCYPHPITGKLIDRWEA